MEAKDTVIMAIEYASLVQRLEGRKFPETDDELASLLCAICKPVAYAQAEISFKAGQIQGLLDTIEPGVKAIAESTTDGIDIGRGEVVEYVEKNKLLYGPSYEDKELWQAKLKEWGIKEG